MADNLIRLPTGGGQAITFPSGGGTSITLPTGSGQVINTGNPYNAGMEQYLPGGRINIVGSGSSNTSNAVKEDVYDPEAAARAQAAAERSRKMAETQAAIDATNQNISAQDIALANRLSTLDQEYQRILSQYQAEVARNQAKYNDQVGFNESTRDRNRHLGLVSAAQGGRGLRATLGSLGALDESGSRLASRAVAQAANMDIGEADRTFETNANQLSTAWGDFKEDDEARRSEAERARISQRENARYESDVAKAGLYEKLGNLYSQREDSANASKYVRQAGDLTAQATSRRPAAVAELKPTAAKFEAGQLAKYLAGQNNMAVTAAQGAASGVPQLFANNRRRDREEAI